MNQVWKFLLPEVGMNMISMPKGSEVLHVADQNGRVCLWAKVSPGEGTEPRKFVVLETGKEFRLDPCQYLGTVIQFYSSYVLHVFELTERISE